MTTATMPAVTPEAATAAVWRSTVAAIGQACPPPDEIHVDAYEAPDGELWLTLKVDVATDGDVAPWAAHLGIAGPPVVSYHPAGGSRKPAARRRYRQTRVEGRVQVDVGRLDVEVRAWEDCAALQGGPACEVVAVAA